jgi:hypothetical protein
MENFYPKTIKILNMKKHYLLISFISMAIFSQAQRPQDALMFTSNNIISGSARNQAIGGALTSLGGDITANHINPAGIGLYRTKEIVFTPGWNFLKNKYSFRETAGEKYKEGGFNYGASGVIIGHSNRPYQNSSSSAFSITINQIANYNNTVKYKGFNNVSSFSEQYLEELFKARATIDQADNNYIFGSSLAFRSFLVDTVSNLSGQVVGYRSLVPVKINGSGGVNQSNNIESTGGAHEIALGFATNFKDKLYLGASLGVPIYYRTMEQTYREEDASTNANNDFSYFEYKESYKTIGGGINAKLGLIYKPQEKVRLGLAIHTPTVGSFNDKISSSLEANTEGYIKRVYPGLNLTPTQKTTSESLKGTNSNAGNYNYDLTTPWKVLISGSYVFNEVKDVRKQRAFVTADIEYVGNRSMRYSAQENASQDDFDYYNELNGINKTRYKGALNAKLGGELKFNTIMVRGGFAYYGSPYKVKELKASRMLLSGGLGYRHKGMFLDVTYVHSMKKDTHQPYVLTDKPNTYSTGKNTQGNVVATIGFKI